MSSNEAKKANPDWTTTFPNIAGWYWVYQALPKGNGEAYFPVWIEDSQSLPLYAHAFYGPLEHPEMPEELCPEIYQQKHIEEAKAKEEQEAGENNDTEMP